MSELMIKQDIVEVGKRMYNREFVAANDGNISVRVSENEIIITPTGISKGYMTTEDMIKVDLEGNVLSGSKKPSSEMKMHLVCFRNRPDIKAVCHAHPQKATAFAVARKICEGIALPEVIFSIGSLALSDYATPTTDELPKSIENIIKTTDAILLSNHGALTVGTDVFDAYYKMETVEHYAGIILYARQLGGEQGLSSEEITKLLKVRSETYGKSDLDILGAGYCGEKAIKESKIDNEAELIEEITKSVLEKIKNVDKINIMV
jgi:L-fuculose-phosphate aldolase